MGYEIDGNNLYTAYGINIERTRGLYDMLERKGTTEYEWDDKDGSQPFTDADDIRFKARDITLVCYMQASTKATFLQYKDNFENMLNSTGLHTFKHTSLDDVHYVYFRDGAPVIPPKWNANKLVGRFTIKLREPEPVTVQFTTDQSTPTTLSMKFSAGNNTIMVYWGDGSSTEQAAVTETEFAHTYTVAGTYQIVVLKNLHELTFFEFSADNATVSGDIRVMGKLNSLADLELYNAAITGNIKSLEHMTTLQAIKVFDLSALAGNLSSLAGLTSLTYIAIGGTAIVGDLESLTALASLTTFSSVALVLTGAITDLPTSLTFLEINATAITGTATQLNAYTSLVTLDLAETAITGSLAQMTALTALIKLDIENTAITGEIKDITDNATSIITLNLKDSGITTYTGSAMPATIKAFSIEGCAVTSVDQISDILEDMDDASVTNAVINLSGGTNAIPDAGGLTAKGNLEGAGCTVTVNS